MNNQLDDFFKNKLQQRTFEYDDSAWEDARLLIEAEERSKRRRYLFFMFVGLSMLMLVGVSAYYLGRNTNTTKDKPLINNTSNQVDTKEETKIIANSDYNESVQTPMEATPAMDKPLAISNTLIEATDPESIRQSANKVRNDSKIKTNNNATVKTENSNNNNNNNNSFNIGNAQGVANSTTTIYNSTTIVTNPINATKATPKLSENLIDSSIRNTKNDLNQLSFPRLNNLSEPNKNELVVNLPALQNEVDGNPLTDTNNNFFFGLRAGMALVPLTFMDIEAGVELGYQINRHWSIATQPKYQYQSLAQNTLDKSEINEFGFGLRSSAFKLEAETVRTIHIPILLSYSFGSQSINLNDPLSKRYLKNKISIGASYIVIDGITGTIFQSESAAESSVYQTGWLADNTFNRHNAEVMIAYDRYFSQRVSLGVQLRYRLRDQFTEAFTRQNQDVLAPSELYLGLQANFKLF